MTPKSRKIIIGLSLGTIAAVTAYVFYKRSKSKKNSALMLEYISGLQKTNTVGAQNQQANANVDVAMNATVGAELNEIVAKNKTALVNLDGKWLNLKNTAQRAEALKKAQIIAKELEAAMKGPGIKKDKFDLAFRRIGTNGAFVLVDFVYKSLFKETLWKAIEGEEVLYKGAGNGWNATIGMFVDLPNYDIVISSQTAVWNKMQKELDKYK